MNKYQIQWATAHDWFIRSVFANTSDGVCVVVRDDMNQDQELTFFNFNELYAWAGY